MRNSHHSSSTLSEDQKGALEGENIKSLAQAMMNTDELEESNADLRQERKGTYRCRDAAEVRRVSLIRFRVMQRPELMKTRNSTATAAAAELERQGESERRKTTEGRK